ncbi:nuclease-related domain-containing protein [Neobacillus massiliamazoniensis]|uniref:NERD domain-containing protein n=1 Tax=Neobacillus massiliamazoniensis TaxID=1499688 RepID=A0A0U1P2E2_9BACI|nr:nuclease-related domain-containing protein [Neobacillus massiliamazoniensis]CRK84383.1 NERD domain-containing protein [Neobacillus massiliamazoniensis]
MNRKPRTEPYLLLLFNYLHCRMNLSKIDNLNYTNLKKGYEGELQLDRLADKLQSELFTLNDLLLETNNTEFQIDSAIITQTAVFLLEIKNYEGEHYYESGRFYTINKQEISNPIHQLNRKETLLRQFLKNHGFHLPIEPYLIFINPEFTLFQAPINKTIILPTQLNRFIEKLDKHPSKLNGMHNKLVDQLISAHKKKSSFLKQPNYEYKHLQKGIPCLRCNSLLQSVRGNKVVCNDCGFEEKIESAVMRCVEEFMFLFPDWKVTTNGIQEWCGVVESKKTIQRILNKYLRATVQGRWTFYV